MTGTPHNGAREEAAFLVHPARHAMTWPPGRGDPRISGGPTARPRPATDPVDASGDGSAIDGDDDAGLARRSRSDAEAFGVLYDRYIDRIYRYVHRRLGNHAIAEDVTADVFLKALRAIDTYRPETAPFSAWLYRIATNTVIDHTRARRPTASLDAVADAADPAAPVEEQAINRLEVARVWAAIDALGEAQRIAVTLRLGQQLPIAAIAEHLGRSEGAVKLLLNRGLTAVREHLESSTGDREEEPS